MVAMTFGPSHSCFPGYSFQIPGKEPSWVQCLCLGINRTTTLRRSQVTVDLRIPISPFWESVFYGSLPLQSPQRSRPLGILLLCHPKVDFAWIIQDAQHRTQPTGALKEPASPPPPGPEFIHMTEFILASNLPRKFIFAGQRASSHLPCMVHAGRLVMAAGGRVA